MNNDLKEKLKNFQSEGEAKFGSAIISTIIVLLFFAIGLGISYLITAAIVAIVCWAFGWTFAWSTALGVWVIWMIIVRLKG